ncbi:MAG TPA: transcription termination/antitermination protein NusG [Nitrospinota bacterium]|jgi:transcriptional antiterminator NusG|nr:transcription termination/antitermination protein NusG [Nitrospinota bacterium]
MIQEPTTPETDQEAADSPDAPAPAEAEAGRSDEVVAEAAAQPADPPAAEEAEAPAPVAEAADFADAPAEGPADPVEGGESPEVVAEAAAQPVDPPAAEEAEGPADPVEGAESPEADAEEAAADGATEEPAVVDDPDKKWYVIHTYSGYESKVKAALEERLQASPLMDLFGAILVPTEDVVEMRGGRRRVSTRKYFPGYILIQMTMNTDTWYLIKNTPKVTGFLGATNAPTPLGEPEVQKLLGQMRGEQTAKPKVGFEEGENVRVVDGPFVNFSGIVEAVNHERGKVRIMVTIFGRPTPVELEFLQVEKV